MVTDPTIARALEELDDLLRERDALAEQVIQLTQQIDESTTRTEELTAAVEAGYAIGYQAAMDEMSGKR